MVRTRTLAASAALFALPLLSACSSGDAQDAATQSASPASSASASASAAGSAAGAESTAQQGGAGQGGNGQTGTGQAGSSAGASAGAQDQGAVEDPCAGTCEQTGTLSLEHPNLGPVEIRTYFRQTSPEGAAPTTGVGSYALYRDGQPIGYVEADGESVTFGPGMAQAQPELTSKTGQPVDEYGNVYLVGDGITVLTRTQQGYDSAGTMPGTGDRFNRATRAVIDADGVATVTVPGEDGGEQDLVWNPRERAFVPKTS